MNVVDSSGWLEYLADGRNAGLLSINERLPTADSVILATARAAEATLWTQDADFEGKAGVRFVAARR